MSAMKGKSLNRVMNKEPDEKVAAALDDIFDNYITGSTKSISLLRTEFNEYFKNERIVSFRKKVPIGLNQKGDAVLQLPKLWILYMFVLHLDDKPFKDILNVLKEGINEIKKPEVLLEGLNLLLDRFPEISITADDEVELNRLLGNKNVKGNKEVLGKSECGGFFLVRLSAEQQKRLKSQVAVVPVKGNTWLEQVEIGSVYPFSKLLAMSNYTYHPNP